MNGNADYLLRGVVKGLNFRFAMADVTSTANTGVLTHDCDPASSWLFARALACGALVSPMLEGGEKYSIRWAYNGKAGVILADVDARAGVRGMISATRLSDMADSEEEIYGDDGTVSVIKFEEGKILNSGSSKAAFLNIADDLAFFLSSSDQLESEFNIGVSFNSDSAAPIRHASGFMIQEMPGCDLEKFSQTRVRLKSEDFPGLLKNPDVPEEKKLIDLLGMLCPGLDKAAVEFSFSEPPRYFCPCDREKMRRAALTLEKDEIRDILEKEGSLKIRCEFCNKSYEFDKKDFAL